MRKKSLIPPPTFFLPAPSKKKMFNYLSKINPLFFLICFCVGLFLSYHFGDKMNFIIKYPTPEDSASLVYRTQKGSCYSYTLAETACSDTSETLLSEKKVR